MNILYEYFLSDVIQRESQMAHIKPSFAKMSTVDMNFRQKFQAKRANGFGMLGFCAFSIGMFLSVATNAQSLNDAIQSAWVNDAALQSAAANRVVAKENVNIAKSRLLPQATLQGSQSSLSQTTTQTTTLGPQASSFKGDSYSYSVSVRQGILRPRDWAGFNLGKQQAYYGEVKFQSAKADLWSRTSAAWLDLLAANSLKLAYEKSIKTVSESAEQEKIRFEKGDGTRDNMIEARAQELQAKAWLKDAELNVQSKIQAFKLLTNLEPRDWLTRKLPDESKVIFKNEDRGLFLERILEGTPELLAARAVERINQLKIDQSYYDHLPTVDVYGQASRAQNDTTNTLGYHYQNQQVGIQFSLPLYAGGGLEATKRQAVASYEASIGDRESLQMRIESQFVSDWAIQAGLSEKASASRALVFSAQEQKRAAELGVQKGQKTWTDISNAEMLLARRMADLVNVQLSLYKVQARILSLLLSDDPAWLAWIEKVDLASME